MCKPSFETGEEELKGLRKENRELRQENELLHKENDALKEQIKEKDGLIEELQRSAKRQAAPFSKGPPKSKPKLPGRKAGPAYGRKGHRPVPTSFDETLEAPLPATCPDCGGHHLLQDDIVAQYQTEIPRKPIRRKFNVACGHCADCGCRVQGRHPLQTSDALGAAASQLGPDAQALAVHLNKEAGLSHGKIARLFETVFGIGLSRGGCAQIMLRAAERCTSAYLNIMVWVRQSRWVVPDETGWKVGGKLQWLHVFAAELATLYLIRDSRGYDVPEDVLGADYAGHMTHDGWKTYDRFTHASHTQCNAHLLRRCDHLIENARGQSAAFPSRIKTLLLKGLALRDARDAGALSAAVAQRGAQRLHNRLLALCTPKSNPANQRFSFFLFCHSDEVFNYLQHPGTDATNWRGEQAIRPAVVNRKVWGGNRTNNGAYAEGVIKSTLRTAAQWGHDTINFLARTLRATLGCEPDLIPNSS